MHATVAGIRKYSRLMEKPVQPAVSLGFVSNKINIPPPSPF